MELRKMIEILEKLESEYEGDYERSDSMANDLLDQAERIMVYHRRIIQELQSQNRELVQKLERLKDNTMHHISCIGEGATKDQVISDFHDEIYAILEIAKGVE